MSNNNQDQPLISKNNGDCVIRVRKDRLGRAHFRPNQLTSGQAARFRRIQESVLNGAIAFDSPILKFVVCLICFDGIVTRIDLMAALKGSIYRWNDNETIEWNDSSGRINRRILSSFSVNAWGFPSSKSYTIDEAFGHIERSLSGIYPLCPMSPIDFLLRDAQAWITEVLQGPLVAHCLNIIPLTGLPGSVLARGVTGLAISQKTEHSRDRVMVGLGQAFDGFFSHAKKDSGDWLVKKIIKACRLKISNKIYLEKNRMLKECLSLAGLACEAGPSSSLLLAWAINLIESGTRGEPNVSPRTIPSYIGSTMELLFKEIKDVDWDDVTVDELEKIYHVIKGQVKPTIRKSVSAALASFHYFLEENLDFPPLKKSLYEGAVELIPRANVIWDHEFEAINTWLESASGDERMINQARVGLTIMRNIRIRISELFTLRLRSIRISPTGLEIEICPMRRDGKLKTYAARRVVQIIDAPAIEIISAWKKRRQLEHAISEDLLFGNPHVPDKGYRLGQLYMLFNCLFKAGAGDESVSCHATSHKWISEQFEKALFGTQCMDINPLDELATGAGHASAHTGAVHYAHFFEKPIRYFLDAAIKSIKLFGSTVEKNSNISAESFRQICCRSKDGRSKQEIAFAVIRQARPSLLVPKVQDLFEMNAPRRPGILTQKDSIKFNDVLNIVTDLAHGMAISAVSSRCNKTEEVVQSVASLGCSLLEEIRLIDRSAVGRDHITSLADFQRFFSDEDDNSIQFLRTHQPKHAPLLRYLVGNADQTLLEEGISAWAACFDRKYISLDRPAKCLGLIKLLKDAGIPNNRVMVCASPSTDNEVVLGNVRTKIDSMFISVYSLPPIVDTKSARRGRPSNYLTISGVSLIDGANVGSAAISMAGFNALMFAARIYLRISSEPQDSSSQLNHPEQGN